MVLPAFLFATSKTENADKHISWKPGSIKRPMCLRQSVPLLAVILQAYNTRMTACKVRRGLKGCIYVLAPPQPRRLGYGRGMQTMNTYKAVEVYEPGKLRVVERPIPEPG